ncbi:MAG: hypothetical protein AAFQ89_20165 [Cyanobacteria bacterium J06626_18]
MSVPELQIVDPSERELIDVFRALPSDKQHEVLDFVAFLRTRMEPAATTMPPVFEPGISFAQAARQYIGCLDGGPEDLSTNPDYMEGFGET